jgi:hypothetical protein
METHLHAACFSHVTSTQMQAIKNRLFATWPIVTVDNARAYLKKSGAAILPRNTSTNNVKKYARHITWM